MRFFNDIYCYQDLRVDKLQNILEQYLSHLDDLVKRNDSGPVSDAEPHPNRKRKGVKPLHHSVDELKLKVSNMWGAMLHL